jgi:hypothetical protein
MKSIPVRKEEEVGKYPVIKDLKIVEIDKDKKDVNMEENNKENSLINSLLENDDDNDWLFKESNEKFDINEISDKKKRSPWKQQSNPCGSSKQ